MSDTSPATPSSASSSTTPAAAPSGGGGFLSAGWIGAIVVVVIAVVVIVLALGQFGPFSRGNTWTAVFLTDNEVFFGHVKSENTSNLELTNVYYLQKSQSNTNAPATLSVLGLVANQVQCPTDDLVINRNVVLYTQQLQSGSYITQQLNQLVQKQQTCFQPSSAPASPAPATQAATPAASASASATP